MTLSAFEQSQFRAYVSHRLLLEVERLIPEYIHTHHHLREDIEDKGYEDFISLRQFKSHLKLIHP